MGSATHHHGHLRATMRGPCCFLALLLYALPFAAEQLPYSALLTPAPRSSPLLRLNRSFACHLPVLQRCDYFSLQVLAQVLASHRLSLCCWLQTLVPDAWTVFHRVSQAAAILQCLLCESLLCDL